MSYKGITSLDFILEASRECAVDALTLLDTAVLEMPEDRGREALQLGMCRPVCQIRDMIPALASATNINKDVLSKIDLILGKQGDNCNRRDLGIKRFDFDALIQYASERTFYDIEQLGLEEEELQFDAVYDYPLSSNTILNIIAHPSQRFTFIEEDQDPELEKPVISSLALDWGLNRLLFYIYKYTGERTFHFSKKLQECLTWSGVAHVYRDDVTYSIPWLSYSTTSRDFLDVELNPDLIGLLEKPMKSLKTTQGKEEVFV